MTLPDAPPTGSHATASFVVGIVGVLLAWAPIIGFVLGAVALALCFVTVAKKQSSPFAVVGGVLGGCVVVGTIIVAVLLARVFGVLPS